MAFGSKKALQPDETWSLFLDRDGVINQRIVDEYVVDVNGFKWIEGVKESITWFSGVFGPIVVVTNQQGIAKGLMTESDLHEIHRFMIKEIEQSGGRIDKVYYCPALHAHNHFCRKPSPGMALKAKKDFPRINFQKSVMVGDSISDMEFGKKLKMTTVFISDDKKLISRNDALIDYVFPGLKEFCDYLRQ